VTPGMMIKIEAGSDLAVETQHASVFAYGCFDEACCECGRGIEGLRESNTGVAPDVGAPATSVSPSSPEKAL
jgi:hypothetical protein